MNNKYFLENLRNKKHLRISLNCRMTSLKRQVLFPFSTATDRKDILLSFCLMWSVTILSQLFCAATSTDSRSSRVLNTSKLLEWLFAALKRFRIYAWTRSLSQPRSPRSARDIGFFNAASWIITRGSTRAISLTLCPGRTLKYPRLIFASINVIHRQNFVGTKRIFNPGQSS